ncbi:hypothetical protein [Arthrobacter sp. Soil736]|uniref:hypothetical protein n=1 Tax=Arthrobacter sp. Soil736 TaxID=1736395 RepID=UPI000A8B441B|nr:hypothetical protein [Arthrobacter sp. Soil736]
MTETTSLPRLTDLIIGPFSRICGVAHCLLHTSPDALKEKAAFCGPYLEAKRDMHSTILANKL